MKPIDLPIATCRVCSREFVQRNSLHRVCGRRCATREQKLKRQAERDELKRRREAAKTRTEWIKDAQTAFNAYIRARDFYLPCVSCGRQVVVQWHAGHYLPTSGRPELRFDERNVNKQCSQCNDHKSGNQALYRVELVKRIGLAAVESLEGPHPPVKYTIDQLREIRDEYRKKARELNDKV